MVCTFVLASAGTGSRAAAAQESANVGAGRGPLAVAVQRLWDADTNEGRAEAIRDIRQLRPGVEEVSTLLSAGRSYSSNVPTGLVERSWTDDAGTEFPYLLWVPPGYDPARRYPVQVYLHGGVSRAGWAPGERWWRNTEPFERDDHIAVFPAAWTSARWWQRNQVESLRTILGHVKRSYNVDENRVSLTGVSDGGTGAYFFAFRDTTPWASFLPFISHPAVLLNPSVGADGSMHLHNLTNKPLFVVNGTDDRLYPTRVVEPFIAEFVEAGVDVTYRPQEGGGHNTEWWPAEAERIEAFLTDHPRVPHPVHISWEVEADAPYTRAHWVTIDELGPTGADRRFAPSLLLDGGAFAGRVEAERDGNTIAVTSANVRRFRLLLSDDVFDLSQPVRVTWNGRVAFDGVVRPDLSTLLEWAELDDDRTMLYQASLTIDWRTR